MNYIEIDYAKIKGFTRLREEQQQLFMQVYQKHNSGQGMDYKNGYTPILIEWIVDKIDDKFSKLKVIFKNGEWLYYCRNLTWF